MRPLFVRDLIALPATLFLASVSVIAQTKPLPQSHTASQLQTLEGDYTGTLQAGEAQLHLVLHLSKSTDGPYHVSLDSLDQGVLAIEANSVSFSANTLKFEVASVGARFEGKVSTNYRVIDGTWSQGSATLPLVFHRQVPGAASRKPKDAVSPVEGLWQGALETHGMRLRLQLHVSHDTEGQLVAALDSLDQGVNGLPAVQVWEKDSAFHFEIPAVAGSYEGKLSPAKDALTGKWSQTGVDDQSLDFKRSDRPLDLRRPQNPVKPYSYREEEVSFSNTAAGVTLEGTLTVPKGAGPFPAAILVAGSGPQDRDNTVANHRPFLVLADYLTRKGIVVLRYDKRGIGKSSGSADKSTTLDFAADTQAAIDFLKARKDVDPSRIGLIGHSEGAMIAPYVAAHSKDVAWIVLLAPPATKGEDTLIKQSELIGRAGGLTDAQLVASLTFDHMAYDLARKEKDPKVLADKLNELVKSTELDAALPPAALEAQLRMMASPWFRFFLDYDPLLALQAVKIPVLVLFGQKDLQVPPKTNLPLVQKALQEAGNTNALVRELPELNHLFQHAYSGTPAEYSAIEETISSDVLQIIGDWIQSKAQQ